MKTGKQKLCAVFLTACLMAVLFCATVFAAAKSISSVTVRVGTDIEAGDTLPDIKYDITDSTAAQDGTYAEVNSTKYYIREAEWITSEDRPVAIGQKPRMRLYLYVSDEAYDEYAFRGTYNSNNVSIRGGKLVNAKRNGTDELEITVELNGIKGQYAPPSDATWKDSGYGKAVWSVDYDFDDSYSESFLSGYYELWLYRDNTVIKQVEECKATSYNFYPYMTREGSYYYRVRTVPHTEDQKKYGTKSEWMDSDEFYIDKDHVSDGSGQTDDSGVTPGDTTKVGWIQSGNTWYFRYPDGTYHKNDWLHLGNIWYLFDESGRMLTGWQQRKGLWYYMDSNGAMCTGWIRVGTSWYYLNKPSDGGTEGAMRTGWLNNSGKTYYLESNGIMAEGWKKIGDNWYYFYPGYGYMATNTTIDAYFNLNADGVWVH